MKIEHVRQKKTWSFTNRAGNRICLYELKESNIRPLYLVEDEVVELEHNDNQEIEVQALSVYNLHLVDCTFMLVIKGKITVQRSQ